MGSGINFTGLSSGIDTNAIVSELMRLEALPVQRMQVRIDAANARKTALKDISTRISTLRTASDAMRSVPFWAGTPRGTTGEAASYALDATSSAPKASYQIRVKQLATGEVWSQTASSGVRAFGAVYTAANVFGTSATKLTALTDAAGASLGLAVGQTISLTGMQNALPITSATPYTVTASSTLDDLKGWIAKEIPGATATIETGGRISIKSPAGTDREVTALAISTGGAALGFDAAFASSAATAAATGLGRVQANDVLHITAGGVVANVAVTAGQTMNEVAAAINGVNGGITASVVDGRLRLAAKDTGVTGGTVVVTSDGAAAANIGFVRTVTAQNGIVAIDGVDQQTERNTTTTLIAGATLSLKQTSANATTGSTDPTFVDPADAEKRAKDFVDAYNALADAINAKVKEQKVRTPKTVGDQLKGTLFNNSTLTTIQSGLRAGIGGPVSGLSPGVNLAADAGISTGTAATTLDQDAIAGRLKFDAAKFQAAFATNRDAVKEILTRDGVTAAEDGIAQRISDLTTDYTKTGGLLAAAIDGSDDHIERLQDQIDRMNARLTTREKQYRSQFTAMERVIGQLRAAGSSLTSALGSLPSNQQQN